MTLRWLGVLIFLAVCGSAAAAEKIVYGGPPAWVIAAEPKGAPAQPEPEGYEVDNPAIEVLLSDTQSKFTAGSISEYGAFRARVKTADGLSLGAISSEWDPATDTLVVHRLQVIREGKATDILRRQKFEILRRERNLEQSMLDGRLTATLQIADLRVGDIVDYAATLTRAQPVMAGRNSTATAFGPRRRVEAARVRYIWDSDAAVHWRVGDDLPRPKVMTTATGGEMLFEAFGLTGRMPPQGAPARYTFGGVIQASQADSWTQLSAAFLPLYAKASQLSANSPLRQEITRIQQEAATPTARASMALKLVEDHVRYVAISMNAQGYTPAAADETWRRRFGDCKAKTALLLALLRELGIEASPVLVSTTSGEAIPAFLPHGSAFDHVIVRAVIDGKPYWLDGTGSGDGPVESLIVPDYGWALPLTAVGSDLLRLRPERLTRPKTQYTLRLDASGGFNKDVPAVLEVFERQEGAGAAARAMAALPKAQLERSIIDRYDNMFARSRFTEATWRYDEGKSRIVYTLKGVANPDMQVIGGRQRFEIPGSAFYPPELKVRPKPQDQSAPYAADDTEFTRWLTVVRLPKNASDYALYGGPIFWTIAGKRTTRWAAKEGEEVTMLYSDRGMAKEISAEDFAKDVAITRTLNSTVSVIMTKADEKAALAADGSAAVRVDGSKDDLFGEGNNRLSPSDYIVRDAGRRLATGAAAEDPALARAAATLTALSRKNDGAGVLKFLDNTALDLTPLGEQVPIARAMALVDLKRTPEAISSVDATLATAPNANLFLLRAHLNHLSAKPAAAEADIRKALEIDPENVVALGMLADLPTIRDDKAALLTVRRSIAAVQPDEPEPLILLARAEVGLDHLSEALQALEDAEMAGATGVTAIMPQATLLMRLKRFDEANAKLNLAVTVRPNTASVLNGACWNRAMMNLELDKAERECERAIALAPETLAQRDSLAFVKFRQGRFADAIADYDKVLATSSNQPVSLFGRGLAKLRLGQVAAGEADIAAALKLTPRAGDEFAAYGVKP